MNLMTRGMPASSSYIYLVLMSKYFNLFAVALTLLLLDQLDIVNQEEEFSRSDVKMRKNNYSSTPTETLFLIASLYLLKDTNI